MKNQKVFSETVLKISSKRTSVYNNISVDSLFQHFRMLFEKYVDSDNEIALEDSESFLNFPISKKEVLLTSRKLKNKQTIGPDGINWRGCYVILFFVFKCSVWERRFFPENSTKSVVLPLFKKGEVNSHNNYRGNSLCDSSVVKFTVQLLILDYKSGLTKTISLENIKLNSRGTTLQLIIIWCLHC